MKNAIDADRCDPPPVSLEEATNADVTRPRLKTRASPVRLCSSLADASLEPSGQSTRSALE